jgi:tripartite-type tricarboxylate transporter receptor subunit TctC
MLRLRCANLVSILCSFAALSVSPSAAQSWPTRPVRFIIPLGPGLGVDITALLVADKVSAKWGQRVVVENKPGGDAIIAITSVISTNDDHILLFAPASTFTAHPLLHEKLPYNIHDLVSIARVTNTLIALGVPTSPGVSTVKELGAEQAQLRLGDGRQRPFVRRVPEDRASGNGQGALQRPVTAINDLSEGRIHAFVGAYAIMRPRIIAGKVKAIALTNREHGAALPDIPTAKEAGFPSLEFDALVGLLGLRRMPQALRERIAADIRQVVDDPQICGQAGHHWPSRQSGGTGGVRRRARRSARHRRQHRQDPGHQTGKQLSARFGE